MVYQFFPLPNPRPKFIELVLYCLLEPLTLCVIIKKNTPQAATYPRTSISDLLVNPYSGATPN